MSKNSFKHTLIISAFPCLGKSYACQHINNLLLHDSDSSEFHFEKNDKSVVQKNWPNNYIKHIKSLIGKYEIIMVSSHKEIREALNKAKIPHALVFPEHAMKQEILKRSRIRGDTTLYNIINENYDQWVTELNDEVARFVGAQVDEMNKSLLVDIQIIKYMSGYKFLNKELIEKIHYNFLTLNNKR